MRIGNVILDTDNMDAADLTVLINELRTIRNRKLQAEELVARMNELISDARREGFVFTEKETGMIFNPDDFMILDER